MSDAFPKHWLCCRVWTRSVCNVTNDSCRSIMQWLLCSKMSAAYFVSRTSKGKGKVDHAPQENVGGCSSPSSRPWARRWRTTNVCDVWPVRCQTYGYHPSRKVSLPIGCNQIVLLDDRGTCVLTACPGLHSTAEWLGFEPTTCWSQVQYPTTMPLSHTTWKCTGVIALDKLRGCGKCFHAFSVHLPIAINWVHSWNS